jgi:hypothetical protein
MQFTLTEEEHKKLPEAFQAEYTVGDDGSFTLTVEGGEDTGALKRAKDHEKSARQKAEADLSAVRGDLTAAETKLEDMLKGAIPKSDVDALESSYKTKYDRLEAELTGKLKTANEGLQGVLVDNVASALANEISTVPALMSEHIKKRLSMEETDGKLTTRVLDAQGQLSALTVDDLKAELKNDATFASIIISSKSSGSGATGGTGGGSADKKFSDMTESERTTLYKADADKYRTLRDGN